MKKASCSPAFSASPSMNGTFSSQDARRRRSPRRNVRRHRPSQTTSSEIMVRTPAPVRGSHQCCTSPSGNCRRAALRICSRASVGSCSRKRQRILQLVAEAERAARLVEGRARPDAAGEALVGQPVVDHRVERLVGRLDLQRVEEAAPVALVLGQALVEILARGAARPARSPLPAEPASPSSQSSVASPPGGTSTSRAIAAQGSRPASTLPDSAAPPRRPRGHSTVPSCPMNSARSAVTDCALPIAGQEGDAVAEVEAVGIAGQQRAGLGVERRHDGRRGLRAIVAEHPFGIGIDPEPAPRPARHCGSSAATASPDRRDRRVASARATACRASRVKVLIALAVPRLVDRRRIARDGGERREALCRSPGRRCRSLRPAGW